MQTVEAILRSKGVNVISVDPDDTVLHALGVMAERDVGAVIVLEGSNVIGILSERDYARKVVLAGRSSKESKIRDVMTSNVITVGLNHTVDDCLALMTDKRIRHLPIVHDDEVVGVISIGDLVKATIAEQEYTIPQLQTYIAG